MTKETLKLSMEFVLDNKDLKDVVDQFCCPQGEEGVVIESLFHNANSEVIKESIKALNLEDKNRVLELGHGNCSHLPFLMDQAAHLKYFGMEISDVMNEEALRLNEKYVKKKDALFQIYDGVRVPYVHNIFDRILTVNTIYFWQNPLNYLKEMFRVLKQGGVFVLAFTNSDFIEELATVAKNNIFVLYNKQKIEEMIAQTDFIVNSIEDKEVKTKNKDGKEVIVNYTVAVLRKKERSRFLYRR